MLPFNDEAIQRGYTAEFNKQSGAAWGDFRLAIVPNLVNERITLVMKQFSGDYLPVPEGLKLVSDYYIYDILREDQAHKDPLILNRPFILAVKFHSDNFFRKKIYFWASNEQEWRALPSSVDYVNGYVRAFSHLPFSRIAAFEDVSELEGKATWYRSTRYQYGAATNHYPLGTRLRVHNVDNNRDVTVEVVSTWTNADPSRVVDLTLPAFEQIGEREKGWARVQVIPLDNATQVLGVDTTLPAQPAVPEPSKNARAEIAINEKTNEIIYSWNYDTVLPIASITKLMTAVVFLETGTAMDKEVTYQREDSAHCSCLYVSPGETMTVKDLFYTMMVGSANNAANALVRSTGLSRDEFVRRMNEKARRWGLTHTHFVDVTGLDPANVSTVYEVALLAKHAFSDFRILQGTTTWEYRFQTINTSQPHTIKNTAKGMQASSLRITGMKTGYLDEALYSFVLKASRSGDAVNNVITVVLGAPNEDQKYEETEELVNYALSRL